MARLVRAAQAGDRSAFAQLYSRHADLVRAIARSHLPFEEAADAVQETFLRALTRIKQLRRAAAFRAWISTIARNIVHDLARARIPAGDDTDERGVAATQPAEMDARAALHAIQSLPKAYQRTLSLRIVEGMTAPEIARQSGLSVGSVRVNLHRGMKLLRERLLKGAAARGGDIQR